MLLSALIAAAESALFSQSSASLARFRHSDDKSENVIAELLDDPIRLRIALTSLNIMCRASIVTLVSLLAWTSFDNGGSIAILMAALSILLIFVCELLPKVIVRKQNTMFARRIAITLKSLIDIIGPLITLAITIRAKFRIRSKEKSITPAELSHALELAAVDNPVAGNEKEILRGIVNFGSLNVKDLMKPRNAISAISADSNFNELIDYINQSGFSRIPVYGKTLDAIEGVLYIKDLLPFLPAKGEFRWIGILRHGFFVQENKKIDLLLKDFQEKRVHMAIVRDDQGRTTGLITLEDLIEEIIGEINDESDEVADNGFRRIDDNTFVFDGRMPMQDFFKLLDQDFPFFREPGEHESLEDFIIEFNDGLPQAGDELYYEQFTFVVEAVAQKRIRRVRVNVHAQA